MGFFSSIKKNFSHGGVKVQLQAPASVSMQDATLPVSVSLTASDSQASVKSIRVEIIAESKNQAFSAPNSTGMDDEQITEQAVARSDYNQPFSLMPGETKTVSVNIVMNQGKTMESQLPQGSAAAQVAHAVGQLQSLAEHMNQNSYSYYVRAVADVDGVTLDPSARQDIQILKPGQIGTGFNIKL